jgi:hypothetical protein
MPLLVKMEEAFTGAGFLVVRFDLAFRQKRRTGPPSGNGAADRDSIRAAAAAMRSRVTGRVVIGGQSYGGRQASMLAAEDPTVADALLLLSYPLHAPGKPEQPRTAHFPSLLVPAVFVQGDHDPFASPEELSEAVKLLPLPAARIVIENAGHDLKRGAFDIAGMVAPAVQELFDHAA